MTAIEEALNEIQKSSPIYQERLAELTLLAKLEEMPQPERAPFLKELGVSFDEFNRIYNKWHHVLEAYRAERLLTSKEEPSNDDSQS